MKAIAAALFVTLVTALSATKRGRRAGILNPSVPQVSFQPVPVLPQVPVQTVPVFVGEVFNFNGQLPNQATKSKPNLLTLISTPKQVVNNISDNFSNVVGLVVDPVVSFLVNASDVLQRGVSDVKSTVRQSVAASIQDASSVVKALHDKKLALIKKPLLPSASFPGSIPLVILSPWQNSLPVVPLSAQSGGGIASGANVLVNPFGGRVSNSQGNLIIGTLVSGPAPEEGPVNPAPSPRPVTARPPPSVTLPAAAPATTLGAVLRGDTSVPQANDRAEEDATQGLSQQTQGSAERAIEDQSAEAASTASARPTPEQVAAERAAASTLAGTVVPTSSTTSGTPTTA